jgi:hypothetical protein
MKKYFTIIFLLMVISASIYLVYKELKPKAEFKNNIVQTPTLDEGFVVAGSYETKTLNPDDPYIKFDIKYPYFKNADQEFNSKIEALIKSQIADNSKQSKENWQARYDTQVKGDNIPLVPADQYKFSFFTGFKVIQSNSSYISAVLNYGGFNGGAHGYENNTSFNYDVKNHKTIELKDVFKMDPNYLTYLSGLSRDYLKKQFAVVTEEDKKNSDPEALKQYVDNITSMIDSGTEPKDENFSTFTFAGNKIRIYFAQYQVGPYVIGSPEIEIDIK